MCQNSIPNAARVPFVSRDFVSGVKNMSGERVVEF